MHNRVLNIVWAALAAFAVTSTASAQFGIGGPGQQDDGPRLTAEIAVQGDHLVAGEETAIGVVMETQDGWKVQAGLGSGDDAEPYLPTTVELDLPEEWQAGRVLWPESKTFTLGEGDFEETLQGYEGRFAAIVHVTVPTDAEPGEYTIAAEVDYQACDDMTCEMPASETVEATVQVVADPGAEPAEPLDEEIAALFEATLSRDHPDDAGDDPGDAPGDDPGTAAPGPDDPGDVPPADEAAAADAREAGEISRPSFFGITLPSTEGLVGLALLALFSAIGGFVLNLTPCVLPVIPIKIMTIIQHANSPGRNLVLGLWMAAGVVAFWVGIGLPVAFLTGVTDPSQLFGIWWVTFGIGAVIALMGLGIMGLFTIELPQSVYAVNPKADTPWGSFVFGIMTAVLGLPCFGFVAGALLAGAATLPPSTIMIIFASLGVGMALPYLVLSLKPSLVEKIPRTGPASELVKQVMGLLLIAAAAYFIGAGLIALVAEHPYLGRQLHWWAVALFVVIAALWLIIRTFQITPSTSLRSSFLVGGLVLSSVATFHAVNSTGNARENWQTRQAALADAGDASYVTGYWNEWTLESFEQARADGHITVLDFTAEWCINCKVLKASVLDRDPVYSELANADVVKFTVDLTSRSAPGWDFLRNELGQTGIPLLAIYPPGSDEPWQSNAYTPQQVLSALEQARNDGAEAFARN